MAFRSRAHRRGFWKGLATGLVLAALALVALALVFPSTRYFAPRVPGDASRAPDAPVPLIVEAPARPLVPGIAPIPAGPVADTPAAGSSLVPLP